MISRFITLLAIALATCVRAGAAENPIMRENLLPGTTEFIEGSLGIGQIEGFASSTSVIAGETVQFYVQTELPQYRIDIFRMGWYQGKGARLMATSGILRATGQPPCQTDTTTRIISCANWHSGFSVIIPQDWLSGVYWVKFSEIRGSSFVTGVQTSTVFVVRENVSTAPYLVQIPFAKYQLANGWGGASLYSGPNGLVDRSFKTSFDRPYDRGRPFFASYEYPMVRWLEKEGYWVSYSSSFDTHKRPEMLLQHKAWLDIGHDEVWTFEMRNNVEAALKKGVSLGFFGGNAAYRQIRFEDSPLGPGHVMTFYLYPELDPFYTGQGNTPVDWDRVTTNFRDRPVNRPENALIGIMYDEGASTDPTMPFDWVAQKTGHWVFEGTTMQDGDRIAGIVGFEYDSVINNALTPANLVVLASSPACNSVRCGIANTSIYQAPSGAWVFAGGTVQWTNGLDRFLSPCGQKCPPADPRLAIITTNILKRFVPAVHHNRTK